MPRLAFVALLLAVAVNGGTNAADAGCPVYSGHVIVDIEANQVMKWSGVDVNRDGFTKCVAEIAAMNPQPTVLIHPTREAKSEDVAWAFAALREAGVGSVGSVINP